MGAKEAFLKTGSYRPAVVAFTMKAASEAKVDAVTFDGADRGTETSPVPMMMECGTPTVYLEAQVLSCCELLRKRGKYVPDIVMAGGFVNETQLFKAAAMSNFAGKPYVKAIAQARAPLTAVFKAKYFTNLASEGKLPPSFKELYGEKPETMFITYHDLEQMFGEKVKEIPVGAIGLYTYWDRIRVGLQQLIAGVRKWRLDLIDRRDLASLTERAYKVTGIPLLEDVEKELIEHILLD